MTSTPTGSDLFLARRAAAGHADAWDQILDRYARRIWAIALQFATDRSEAEDLCQDIFLRLYQNLHRYRGEVPFAGWALRVSRNLCIDHYRRRRRLHTAISLSDELLEELPDDGSLQRRAEQREELLLVMRALREMPEDFAIALVLRDLQGWTYEEVATFLELPLGTVKSRIHRARLELGRRLEPYLQTTPSPAREVPQSC